MEKLTTLPIPFLVLIVGLGLSLAAVAPLYSLLLLDLILIWIVDQWRLLGTWVDTSDLILGSLFVGLVIRARFSPLDLIRKLPYLLPWLTLGTFITLSYINAPQNADNLTDPVRIVYQVYRYCWKPLLYYPICLLLLRDLRQGRNAWLAILIGGDICAAMAVWQGYNDVTAAPGPFTTGNGLAAVLVVPFVVTIPGVVVPTSRFNWLFSTASMLLIIRALLFTASRGGIVAAIVGGGVIGGLAVLTSSSRTRIIKLLPLAFLGVVAVLIYRPNILERPTIRYAMTLFRGTSDHNMQWRMTERWPHFLEIAKENPILGTGTYVDPTLSKKANTPHNGYLALAVKYGFPVLALYLFFILRLLRDCQIAAYRRAETIDERIFFLTLAAAILGLATHNLVESTLTMGIIQKFFWMFVALAAAYTRLWQTTDQPATRKASRAGLRRRRPRLAPA